MCQVKMAHPVHLYLRLSFSLIVCLQTFKRKQQNVWDLPPLARISRAYTNHCFNERTFTTNRKQRSRLTAMYVVDVIAPIVSWWLDSCGRQLYWRILSMKSGELDFKSNRIAIFPVFSASLFVVILSVNLLNCSNIAYHHWSPFTTEGYAPDLT